MTERTDHLVDIDAAETVRIGNKIRKRRKELKLTLEEVAQASSLSTGFLSLVERDLSYPSLTTLSKIANAIQTPVDALMSFPKGEGSVSRAKNRAVIEVNEGGVRYARLSAEFNGAVMKSVEITLPPHYSSEVTTHSGEELIYILSGQLSHVLDGREDVLKPGDCVHFQSTLPHRWINNTDQPVRLLWVGDLPIFPKDTG